MRVNVNPSKVKSSISQIGDTVRAKFGRGKKSKFRMKVKSDELMEMPKRRKDMLKAIGLVDQSGRPREKKRPKVSARIVKFVNDRINS